MSILLYSRAEYGNKSINLGKFKNGRMEIGDTLGKKR
jgi:hypothetical protein